MNCYRLDFRKGTDFSTMQLPVKKMLLYSETYFTFIKAKETQGETSECLINSKKLYLDPMTDYDAIFKIHWTDFLKFFVFRYKYFIKILYKMWRADGC